MAARLTQEGHLTAAERDRRLREGRCLYCASLEHRYVDCPKNTRPTVNHPGGSSSSTPPVNSGAGCAGRSQRLPGVPATSNNNNNGNFACDNTQLDDLTNKIKTAQGKLTKIDALCVLFFRV